MKAAYWLLVVLIGYFILAPTVGVVLYGILPDPQNPSAGTELATGTELVPGNEQVAGTELVPGTELVRMLRRSMPLLGNSLYIAVPVAFLATVIGAAGAIAVKRLLFPGRRVLRFMYAVPLVSPPFVGSLSFIMLFGRRGLITNGLLGLEVSPFGWQGIVVLQTISYGALAFLVITSGLERLDTTQESAARTLGAGEWRVFFDVTLPFMLPELSTAAVLVFLGSLADFGTPLIIGGAYRTLAADLYVQITGLYDMKSAAVSGLLLLAPSLAVFFLNRRAPLPGAFYVKGSQTPDLVYASSDPWLAAGMVIIAALYSLLVAVQAGFILLGAFAHNWRSDWTPTLAHFGTVVRGDLAPFANSVALALIAATGASLSGVLLAYLLRRGRLPLAKLVDLVTTLPAAVPGILFGIGYLVIFRYPLFGVGRLFMRGVDPPILLGTGSIIFILCVFRYMHVGLRSGSALLEHIDPDLEDAARNLGQGDTGVWIDITMPLLAPALYAAFVKTFATTMTTLGAIIFLILPSNKVAVQQLFQIVTGSGVGAAAAMGVMLAALTLAMLALFRGIAGVMTRRVSWQ